MDRKVKRARVNSRRRLRDQDGAALVEFALVLPLLLLLLLGTVEFGRVFNYWIDENHLANAAARWAAVDKDPGPGSSLQRSILEQADTGELREGGTKSVPSPAQVCIRFPDGGEPEVGDPVEAKVSVDFNWMPIIGDAMGGVTTTTLTSSATMRMEQAPSEYGEGC